MTATMEPVAVVSCGVCTPLGFSVPAVDAAVRAGLVMFAETPWSSRRGERLRASAVHGLDWDVPLTTRLGMLAEMAIKGTWPLSLETTPEVYLALPRVSVADAVLEALGRSLPLVRGAVRLFEQGRSAFFFALEAALTAINTGRISSALVGGVDSLCAHETILELDEQERVLGASRAGGGGLVPAEGAGFLLLASVESRYALMHQPAGMVLAAATGFEQHHFLQEEPNRADGLTSVFHDLHGCLGSVARRADVFHTCETSEPFWAEEVVMASLRANALMPEPFARRRTADSFGDLGAASGAVMLAIGLHATGRHAKQERQPSSLLLVCGSGDEGGVGGCLAQSVEQADRG